MERTDDPAMLEALRRHKHAKRREYKYDPEMRFGMGAGQPDYCPTPAQQHDAAAWGLLLDALTPEERDRMMHGDRP